MPVPVKPKRGATADYVPTPSDLQDGEIGVNTSDRIIYQKVGDNVIPVANYKKLTVSNTAPSSPEIGDLWVDTN